MYLEEGLEREDWPDKIKEVSENFVSGTSAIQRFITDRLEKDDKGRERVEDLFSAWKSWCTSEGMERKDIGEKGDFKTLLESNGFKYIQHSSLRGEKNVNVFKGLKLK